MADLKPGSKLVTGANVRIYIFGNLVATATRATLRWDQNIIDYDVLGQRHPILVPGKFTVSGNIEKALVSLAAMNLSLGKIPSSEGELDLTGNTASYPDISANLKTGLPDWPSNEHITDSGLAPFPYKFDIELQVEAGVAVGGVNTDRRTITLRAEGCFFASGEVTMTRTDIVLESITFRGETLKISYEGKDDE